MTDDLQGATLVPAADASPQAPSGSDAVPRMLDPRVITVNRIAGSVFGLVVGGMYFLAVVVTLFAAGWPLPARLLLAISWFPVAGLLAWSAIKWPQIDYRYWRYRIDAAGIEIWSGVLWRERVMVPRSRVQHIDVSQGPLERSYGLATLSIHTAGTQYSKVDLPGLDHSVALQLRDALLPKDAEPPV